MPISGGFRTFGRVLFLFFGYPSEIFRVLHPGVTGFPLVRRMASKLEGFLEEVMRRNSDQALHEPLGKCLKAYASRPSCAGAPPYKPNIGLCVQGVHGGAGHRECGRSEGSRPGGSECSGKSCDQSESMLGNRCEETGRQREPPGIAKRGFLLSRGREDFSTQSRICLGSRARTWQIANHKRRRGGVGTLLLSWVMDASCK